MKIGDLAKINNTFDDKNVLVPVFTKNPTAEKIDPKLDTKLVKPGNVVMVLNLETLESQTFDDYGNITCVCINFVNVLYCEDGKVSPIWIWEEELEKIETI